MKVTGFSEAGRSFRWRVVVALVAVSVVVLAGLAAKAAAAETPPIPGLLGGGLAEDPVQTTYEGALRGFLHSTYDRMVHDGCADALSAYFAAARQDDLLERAYEGMLSAHEAMNQTDFATMALITSRLAQLTAETAVFLGGVPAVASAISDLSTKLPELPEDVAGLVRAVGDAFANAAKDVG